MQPPVDPFRELPHVQGSYVIHETKRVQYLIKNLEFKDRVRFKLKDHQFCLTGHLKPDIFDEDAPFHGKKKT
jgi:hypothetical protein